MDNQQQEETKVEKKEKKITNVKRDHLIKLQQQAQEFWKNERMYQVDPNPGQKKFFMCFPYPYLNGKLHLGHVFSMTKADFTCRFRRIQGYNALFPFAFHCTGQPICAAADRLKHEMETYGFPPKFPEKPKQEVPQQIEEKQQEQPEQKQEESKNDKQKKKGGKKEGKKEEKKEEPKKEKKFQYEIMQMMDIPEQDIPKFTDAKFYSTFFQPLAIEDLNYFGAPIDWRRSFITTEMNPYYDSFIRWQFTKLFEKHLIKFGKRPSIYCIKDKQMCADHDRAEGEGVGPQEYTLIKLKILDHPKVMKEKIPENSNVFLVAATLRPETMYGQTNCFILPTGLYGVFKMKNNEYFVCSERSVKNMSYQELTEHEGQYIKVMDIEGKDLLGLPLKAPLSSYEKVYSLPMMTISMTKGTGVVTSVPSDAPDDYAALMDLKKKEQLRQKFGITADMVEPYQPVGIIDLGGEFGVNSAVKLCEKEKVQSQNDKDKLQKIKDLVYKKGFYEGKMVVGKYAGQNVEQAKAQVKKDLIESNEAASYYEPESLVISRSQEECIVAFCDQWYIRYNDEDWTQKVVDHVKNNFITYGNKNIQQQLMDTAVWLKEWGCSRSFGLGTRLPFDEKYLIESLSDSTIYFAFYTIAHFLQSDVKGEVPGKLNILPQQLNNDVWDYIFLKGPYNPEKIQIPEEKLKTMRDEFEYWYPVDMRCSAKDLIRNHLTMSLFNHAAIWENHPEKWTKSYFVNGYILVDGDKMSKQKGNFFTVRQIIDLYGADAVRFAMAEAGDTEVDANFTQENADRAVLKFFTMEEWMRQTINAMKNYRNDSPNKNIEFFDRAFENEIKHLFVQTINSYEQMKFRDVCKFGFHMMETIKEQYLINCEQFGPRKDLIKRYIEIELLLMFPITPHWTEIIYKYYFYPSLENKEGHATCLSHHKLPNIQQQDVDQSLANEYKYVLQYRRQVRLAFETANTQQNVKKGGEQDQEQKQQQPKHKFNKIQVVYTREYNEWQKYILVILNKQNFNENQETSDEWKKQVQADKNVSKEDIPKMLKFGTYVLDEFREGDKNALNLVMPFDELALMQSSHEFICKDVGVQQIDYLTVEEAIQKETVQFLRIITQNNIDKHQEIKSVEQAISLKKNKDYKALTDFMDKNQECKGLINRVNKYKEVQPAKPLIYFL